jgi:hypothetical protein
MSSRSLRLLPALPIGALLFAAFCLPASGQGKDELWDITMKMDMPGMPMAMPARTQRMCVEKSASDDSYVPKQEDCKTVESRRSGNKFTYKMVCTGKNPMTATGEMTFVEGGYEGTMHMTGTMEGRPMDMTQTYSGKRVGNCTSTAKADAKAMEDKSKQSVAEACRSGLENLQAPYFLEPRALCAAQKAEFCGAVSAKAKAMHEPAEFQAAVHKYVDLGGTMSKCGENLPAVAKVACARAWKHGTGRSSARVTATTTCEPWATPTARAALLPAFPAAWDRCVPATRCSCVAVRPRRRRSTPDPGPPHPRRPTIPCRTA